MTINLDGELVGTRYEPLTQTNFYTIERNGHRWTVAVHDDHLHAASRGAQDAHQHRQRRRDHVAMRLRDAMMGPHDPLPAEEVKAVNDNAA